MYPAVEGAFVGSDLSGEVVKLGPNLQKDIKIGDVVGASVVGGTFPVSPQFQKERKLITVNTYRGLQVSRVDVALSPNTRRRIPTLSGRFPRERTPLKRSLQLAYRRPIIVFAQQISSLTPMARPLDSTQHSKPCTDPEISNLFSRSTVPPLSKTKLGFSSTEGARASVCTRFSSQSSRGTRSLQSLRLVTTSSSKVTEQTPSSTQVSLLSLHTIVT